MEILGLFRETGVHVYGCDLWHFAQGGTHYAGLLVLLVFVVVERKQQCCAAGVGVTSVFKKSRNVNPKNDMVNFFG
jgi:hypothetical protein